MFFLEFLEKKMTIENEISRYQIKNNYFEIIDCEDIVQNNDTPLSA